MKLIIDISEEAYKNLQKRSTEIQAEGYLLENLVLNGTLLSQEPKTGHWIDINGIYAKCSNCNEEIYITGDFKYCPNCGTRMEF